MLCAGRVLEELGRKMVQAWLHMLIWVFSRWNHSLHRWRKKRAGASRLLLLCMYYVPTYFRRDQLWFGWIHLYKISTFSINLISALEFWIAIKSQLYIKVIKVHSIFLFMKWIENQLIIKRVCTFGWMVVYVLVVLNKGSDEFRACKACKKIAWADFIAVFRWLLIARYFFNWERQDLLAASI